MTLGLLLLVMCLIFFLIGMASDSISTISSEFVEQSIQLQQARGIEPNQMDGEESDVLLQAHAHTHTHTLQLHIGRRKQKNAVRCGDWNEGSSKRP